MLLTVFRHFFQADKLLSPEFQPVLEQLVDHCARKRQICLFSATFPVTVKDFKDKHITNPYEINLMDELTLKARKFIRVDNFFMTLNGCSSREKPFSTIEKYWNTGLSVNVDVVVFGCGNGRTIPLFFVSRFKTPSYGCEV